MEFEPFTFGGNQIDGMYLEKLALQNLIGISNSVGKSMYSLYDLPLNYILPEFNLKRHLDGDNQS